MSQPDALTRALDRYREVLAEMSTPEVASDPSQLESLGRELSDLEPIAKLAKRMGEMKSGCSSGILTTGVALPELNVVVAKWMRFRSSVSVDRPLLKMTPVGISRSFSVGMKNLNRPGSR